MGELKAKIRVVASSAWTRYNNIVAYVHKVNSMIEKKLGGRQ
ncbi:hypothetical protein [Desulfosporosinus sp. OT]|nr:hypothetical protein [Desulfosporosinus sp. OT]EGW37336.1 hypothetical protein DOT_4838 [Desulfosporosinus sp. OT]